MRKLDNNRDQELTRGWTARRDRSLPVAARPKWRALMKTRAAWILNLGCPRPEGARLAKRTSVKSRLTPTLTTLCMLALVDLGWAQAPPLSPNTTNFPMIGITRGQTLLVSLVAFPPAPCVAQLGFQDSSGNPVGSTRSVTLAPGQSASLALNGNSLTNSVGQRVEVLPTIVPAAGVASECQGSAEVFDNVRGGTSVLIPGAIGFPPNPALGMLGVNVLQTVRLIVVAFPPDPCFGQIGFADRNGNPVGNAVAVNLAPGQAAFLDLPGNTLVTTLGRRAEVRPIVTLTNPTGAPDACIASAELYTNAGGRTAVYYPPAPCSPLSTSCVVY